MLCCKNVYKSYGGESIFKGMSMSIDEGDRVALYGGNGSGKSTLVNIISGFESVDDGECLLNGTDLTRLEPYQIARLGISRIFQNTRLIQDMSVKDNLMIAQFRDQYKGLFNWRSIDSLHLHIDEEIRHFLTEVFDRDIMEKSVGRLSYGQKKIISVVCCFVGDPNIALLDEPVSGIDDEIQQLFREFISSIDEDVAVLIVEHDSSFLNEFADYIYEIKNFGVAKTKQLA